MSTIASVHHLTFCYPAERTPVFQDFDWSIERGDRYSVVGPSGCGKTTLLYLLAGLQQPAAGEIQVDGAPVPRPRATTGLILQDHGLLPWATVRQNATLGLRMGRFYRRKQGASSQPRPYPPNLRLETADHWLERLGVAHLGDKYPAQLSGGQRQRVAIARTLALRPNLLLMDEPFSALDPVIRENMQELVVELQLELGITTAIVTHNVAEAAFLGRRILVLGQPPNRHAVTVDNPAAGDHDYRRSELFDAMCERLRNHLGTRP